MARLPSRLPACLSAPARLPARPPACFSSEWLPFCSSICLPQLPTFSAPLLLPQPLPLPAALPSALALPCPGAAAIFPPTEQAEQAVARAGKASEKRRAADILQGGDDGGFPRRAGRAVEGASRGCCAEGNWVQGPGAVAASVVGEVRCGRGLVLCSIAGLPWAAGPQLHRMRS